MGDDEQPFSSTTWTWKRVKIARPAGGHSDSAAQPLRWYRLPPWPLRRPMTLSVKYRGGAEAWYEIHARGSSGRFVGSTALHDVMREISRQ